MATYDELRTIKEQPGWGELVEKIRVAVGIKAGSILDEPTPSDNAKVFAQRALASPATAADQGGIITYVISANNTATINQILNALDATIQSNVDTAIEALRELPPNIGSIP